MAQRPWLVTLTYQTADMEDENMQHEYQCRKLFYKDAVQDIDTAVTKSDRLTHCPHSIDRLRALVLDRTIDPLSGKTNKKKLLANLFS